MAWLGGSGGGGAGGGLGGGAGLEAPRRRGRTRAGGKKQRGLNCTAAGRGAEPHYAWFTWPSWAGRRGAAVTAEEEAASEAWAPAQVRVMTS